MSRYNGNHFAELHRANGSGFGGHFRRAHQTVHSVLVAAVLPFRLWAKWRQSDFFPLRSIITMPMIMSVGFARMLVVVALCGCVRACVRARMVHDSFLIELSSCL